MNPAALIPILVVEDSAEDFTALSRAFRKNAVPNSVLRCADGDQALEYLQGYGKRPDWPSQLPVIILLDLNLPGTDGLALLAALGELAPPDTLCVVMITGGGNETLAVRALNSGALDYLVKQKFDRELLNKTVLYAIAKNEWRQYVARYHGELQGVNRELRDSLAELTETRQELHEKNAQLSAANQEIGARNRLLAHTNQDLDNFVYAASHDLRQPLDNLRGLFDELRRTATFQDPDEAVVLRLPEDSLHSLSTTITDLAAVVQEQRNPGEQAVEQVALAGPVADVLSALRPRLVATDAHIDTDFAGLPALRYVRGNLRTILVNLLSNALKYRHPARAPRIQVRTYQADGCPVLEVRDNGLGLNLNRYGSELFQLFRRFHPQAGEGTGVGLFLVNRLVLAEGGNIDVESEEGQGTVFRVFLHGNYDNC